MANMQKMMKEMQKMQSKMAQLQDELAQTPVEGSAGGGVVTATVNGAHQVLSVNIDPEVVDPEDVEMLNDLVVAAVNDAMDKAQALSDEKMGSLTKGIKMPGGLF